MTALLLLLTPLLCRGVWTYDGPEVDSKTQLQLGLIAATQVHGRTDTGFVVIRSELHVVELTNDSVTFRIRHTNGNETLRLPLSNEEQRYVYAGIEFSLTESAELQIWRILVKESVVPECGVPKQAEPRVPKLFKASYSTFPAPS